MTVMNQEKKLLFVLKEKKSGPLQLSIDDFILINDSTVKQDLIFVNTIKIEVNDDITTSTMDINGLSQDGKTVILQNGEITRTITINKGLTANYLKVGDGEIVFLEGVDRTLIPLNGTNKMDGGVGSTASIISNGFKDYLTITNAIV